MAHFGNMSEAELARRAKVDQTTVNALMNIELNPSTQPKIGTIEKLAGVFKLKVWHLCIPDASVDMLLDGDFTNLIKFFNALDKHGQQQVLRTAENEVRYKSPKT